MAQAHVSHTLGDLYRDLQTIQRRVRPDCRAVVRDGIKAGNLEAKTRAKRTAGEHGKLYHRAFGYEMHGGLGLFGNVISGEYGPDANKPQGGMSFERGSRNQPAHLDLTKSADLIGPVFAREVRQLPDQWFWPGAS